MTDRTPADLLGDRFRGALLGTAIGDALGMPVEGMPPEWIASSYGEITDMLPARLGRGTYTDDTQMMIALAEALLETPGKVDPDRIARSFAEHYEPARGYGGNTHRILTAIRSGEPWRTVLERLELPGGSFANGAAMRVTPVALAFFGRPQEVARAAEQQAEVTGHRHPLGRFGARLQALAVWQGLAYGVDWNLPDLLDRALEGAPEPFRQALEWIRDHREASPEEAVHRLGNSGEARASVPIALWAFLSRRDDPEAAVIRAVGLGGDTDTIGAMTGAVAGAAHGASRFPSRWTEELEKGPQGRDYILSLADRFCQTNAP